jgi:hypothetical protein
LITFISISSSLGTIVPRFPEPALDLPPSDHERRVPLLYRHLHVPRRTPSFLFLSYYCFIRLFSLINEIIFDKRLFLAATPTTIT